MSKGENNRNYHLRYSETGEVVSFLKLQELQSLAEDGHISPADRVRKEGHRTWHLASTVIGLRIDAKSNEVKSEIDCPSPETGQVRNVLLSESFLISRCLQEEDLEDHVSVTPKKSTKYANRFILFLILCLLSVFPIFYYSQHYMKADSSVVLEEGFVVLPQSTDPVINPQLLAVDKPTVELSDNALSEPPEEELEPKVSADITKETSNELAQSEPVPEVLPEVPNNPAVTSAASSKPTLPPAIAWLISLKPQPITKYVTILIKGEVGVVPKDRNGNYTTEFICAHSLDKLFRSLDKKKNIKAVIFIIDSINGDVDELADIELVLAEFDNRFSYHAAVIRSGTMDKTVLDYCGDREFKVSNINGISTHLPDGFIEDETKNKWATKYLRTQNKRLIKPIEDEFEIGRLLIDTMNNSKDALAPMCDNADNAEKLHPINFWHTYEKATYWVSDDVDGDGVTEKGEGRLKTDPDRLSTNGERQYNQQGGDMRDSMLKITNVFYSIQSEINKLNPRWNRALKSQCNTFTHREQRRKLIEDLKSGNPHFIRLLNAARPCVERLVSQIDNLPYY